jgi:hypothetical protein
VSNVRFLPIGPVLCAALPWWLEGAERVSVIVKASLALTPNGVSSALCDDAEPMVRGGDDSDLVPHLTRAEVLCIAGAERGPSEARLRVLRQGSALIDAVADRSRSFGPIPMTAPARAELLTPERAAVVATEPLHLQADFPWEVFQAAAADQRTSALLRGDETILLEELRSPSNCQSFTLPAVTARAWILHQEQPIADLPLRLDRIKIDLERGRISLVWRTCVAAGANERLVVAAGATTRGEPVLLPRLARSAPDALHETSATHVAGLHAATMPFRPSNEPDDTVLIPS